MFLPRWSYPVLVVTAATLAVIAIVFVAQSSADPVVPAQDVKVWEAKQGDLTLGETIVDAPPDEVYRAVADYTLWTSIFPKTAKVTLESGQAPTAVVAVTSKKGKKHTLTFDNDAKTRTIRFSEDAGRATIRATLVFEAGDTAGTTRARARLSAKVNGAAGLFVTKSKIRGKRQKRVSDDLAAIRAYFATP